MGTHSFLSPSSQLPFLLAAALSIILREWGSPGFSSAPKIPNHQRQVQAKIWEPHNGADRQVALPGWTDGAPRLPRSHSSTSSFVSTPGAKGAVVLCHLREEKITSSWGRVWKRACRPKLHFPCRSFWHRRLLKRWQCSLKWVTSDSSSPPLQLSC